MKEMLRLKTENQLKKKGAAEDEMEVEEESEA